MLRLVDLTDLSRLNVARCSLVKSTIVGNSGSCIEFDEKSHN
ncbi:hypothetical protein [Okeania sp. SIO2C9]|nr:hypothetical protein [Okeania sp. SIO2C9]